MIIREYSLYSSYIICNFIKLISFTVDHLYRKALYLIKVDPVPPVPTREQELEYLENLQKSFLKQNFFSIHPRYTMAHCDRETFLQKKKYQWEYLKCFFFNMIFANAVAYPLIT